MSDEIGRDDAKDVVSAVGCVSRADLDALRRCSGPTQQESEAIPAITAEDWPDAEVIAPMPPDIAQVLLDRERATKKTA